MLDSSLGASAGKLAGRATPITLGRGGDTADAAPGVSWRDESSAGPAGGKRERGRTPSGCSASPDGDRGPGTRGSGSGGAGTARPGDGGPVPVTEVDSARGRSPGVESAGRYPGHPRGGSVASSVGILTGRESQEPCLHRHGSNRSSHGPRISSPGRLLRLVGQQNSLHNQSGRSRIADAVVSLCHCMWHPPAGGRRRASWFQDTCSRHWLARRR